MDSYDWDADEEWKKWVASVDVVGDTAAAMGKLKLKYYRRHVDPNYNPYSQQPQQQQQQQQQSAPRRGGGQQRQSAPRRNAAQFNALQCTLGVAFCGVAATLLISALLLPQWHALLYLAACGLSCGWWALKMYTAVGAPRWNRQFWMAAFGRDEVHYLCYSLLYFVAYPSVVQLVPLFLYIAFNTAAALPALVPRARRLSSAMAPYSSRALQVAVQVEEAMMVVLLLRVFGGTGSIVTLFGHYQFLKFRYMLSPATRALIDAHVAQVDAVAGGVPVVGPIYWKIRRWLSTPIVHPAAQQQEQQ